MEYFAGLDVSDKTTSVLGFDGLGEVALRRKVPSGPEAIIAALRGAGIVCLEAGRLSQWL
jgi:transposase